MKHHPMRAGVLALVAIWAVAVASTAAAADRVRVGKAVPFAWTFTPIDVGIAVGIFAKHGLELEVTGFAGDARLQQGLASDSIDFGLGSGAGMGFLAKGVPAKAVAAMAGAPMNMSMVVSYESPIKTLDDIKGKKVGITTVGSLTDWLLKRVVSEKKWAPTDVTAVTVGGMDSTKAALKTGQIDAVVIGAGFSGLYMLHKLRDDLGLTVRVCEAGGNVGGTWYWNRYPGARCDSDSYIYCYSFDQDLWQEWEWSERYPEQHEIRAYLEHVTERYDLAKDIRFETRVTAATFDEDAAAWTVETDTGERVTARFVITAVVYLAWHLIAGTGRENTLAG